MKTKSVTKSVVRSVKDSFRTICLTLVVGLLAGAGAAICVLAAGAHSKIGLAFARENGSQRMELDYPDIGDATGRPPRFWGLQVGNGDSLTTIGVYSLAPAHAAKSSPRLPE